MPGTIVRRSQRVAFMNVGTKEAPKYARMTGFTSFSNAKNPKEYTRHYVDEDNERSDVVGYAPAISYSFDRHSDNEVHTFLSKIHDGELLGNDTHAEVVVVDLFDKQEDETYSAVKRTYATIPNEDGNGTEALIYSGTLKSSSPIEKGTATITDDGKAATYVAPENV